ncbi:MAG: ABC transporter substrate-binding protein, partial [Clostridiales bacterium]|nr:ABC transporter substrate-binding protein [Clostridiales bacterium]
DMKKRVVSLLLVGAMALSLAACGGSSSSDYTADDTSAEAETTDDTAAAETTEGAPDGYDETSAEIYDAALGDFYEVYLSSLEAESTSERWALMAQAEAYLLESGITIPTNTQGGYTSMTRVAPYTSASVLWGLDTYRYGTSLVTEEIITTEDIAAMKEKWGELKGTGTYLEWAESYLTENGYTLKDSYGYPYNADPATWDVFASYLSTDLDASCNTVDGLVQYDAENELQPALAESWEVSDDGLTYTFHLREGVQWVDSQGRELGELTADDFVAGMQHLMDAQGGMEYLIEGVIVNATEYIYGEVTDISEVGVEATDDYTLVYTLEEPCSYFMTMLSFSVFAPLDRDYYESCGGGFGSEYDNSASDYTYGTDSDHIAYCGPYVVTNATAANKIVFSANESYYNADAINVKTLTWVYEDGSDATKKYNDFIAGTLDNCVSLNTSSVEVAKEDGNYDLYAYTTDTDATTYQSFMNLNRNAFANTNDTTTAVSSQTEEEAARTNIAVQNQNFRLAADFAFDRGSYNAQSTGEDLKYTSLRNSIVPGNFVSLEEDVTIDINGTATTFEAGTYYGEIVQAQIDADGIPITAWDPDANDGIGSSDGYDGWYNADNAMEYLEMAIEELAEEGLTIDEDNPIYLDLPYPISNETYTNRANAYKQSVEASLNGLVIVNLVECTDTDEWLYTGYYTDYGYEMNYDLFDLSGWIPDYGDPDTYLNCFLPDYDGYMTKCFGIY